MIYVKQLNDVLKTRLRFDIEYVVQTLQDFCERHRLLKLSVFGSVLRDDFRIGGHDPSDIDILVEFDPAHVPDWEYYLWGDELASLWQGVDVDLLTQEELSPYFRQNVLQEAIRLYERAR